MISWHQLLRPAAATLGIGVVLIAAACDDDTNPPGVPISLETIWPNEDGRTWQYLLTESVFENLQFPDSSAIYPNEADVPPAPTIDAILPLIDDPPLPDSVTTTTSEWGLSFQGMTTTESGVTAQNLVEFPGGVPALAQTAGGPAKGHTRPASSFVAHLLRARPELRQRILGLETSAQDFEPTGPLFLHGGAWEKTASWIGAYSNLDTRLAWKYLENDLVPGRRFSYQLIPTIVDDVYLHALVRREVTLETPVGTFQHVLEVVYLVDYGVSQATDAGSADPFGYFRVIEYGNVLYAPTIGPVAVYERGLVSVAQTLGTGIGDLSLELTAVQAGPEVQATRFLDATPKTRSELSSRLTP